MDILYFIITFILGGVIAWFIQSVRLRMENRVLAERNESLDRNLKEAKSQLGAAQDKTLELTSSLAATQADFANAKEMEARLTKEFENLAHKTLEVTASKLTDQNKSNIDQLLSPLKTQIDGFKSTTSQQSCEVCAIRIVAVDPCVIAHTLFPDLVLAHIWQQLVHYYFVPPYS